MGKVRFAGRWVSVSDALVLNHPGHSPQKVHGGGGSDDDDLIGEGAGAYGFGRDPNGVSYTEFDVDEETGEPKFSQSYRDEYGPLDANNVYGSSGIALASGRKKGIHIADDSAGTQNRRVIQDLSNKQANALGEGMYEVYAGQRDSFTTAGVTVTKAGPNPTQDGVRVRWKDGTESHLQGEAGDSEAFDFQEGLDLQSGGG